MKSDRQHDQIERRGEQNTGAGGYTEKKKITRNGRNGTEKHSSPISPPIAVV
jgi:hypothetical protein